MLSHFADNGSKMSAFFLRFYHDNTVLIIDRKSHIKNVTGELLMHSCIVFNGGAFFFLTKNAANKIFNTTIEAQEPK